MAEEKKNKITITPVHVMLYFVLAGFLLLLVYIVYNHERERKNPHALQMLEKRYEDSLQKVNNEIIERAESDKQQRDNTIAILRDSTNSLKEQLKENEHEITQIQKRTDTKIKYVNTLSDDSLTQYFLGLVRGGFRESN